MMDIGLDQRKRFLLEKASFFRIKEDVVRQTFRDLKPMQDDDYKMLRVEVYFKPTSPNSSPKYNPHHGNLRLWYGKIIQSLRAKDNLPQMGKRDGEKGWLVCSGGMQNKKMHHLITDMDNTAAQRIPIDSDLIDFYRNDLSQEIKENKMTVLPEKENRSDGKPVPCFYIEEHNRVIAFGHTQFLGCLIDTVVVIC